MSKEILVPTLGESVAEATVANWMKKVGDTVAVDESLVELETDKVTLEVPSPADGVLVSINVDADGVVEPGAVLGLIDENAEAAPSKDSKAEETNAAPSDKTESASSSASNDALSPAVAKIVAEKDVDPSAVEGTGKDGRLTKGDVLAAKPKAKTAEAAVAKTVAPIPASKPLDDVQAGKEERVRMSRLRQTIARRLKAAQDTAAMLTTYNEVDMTEIMAMRKKFQDDFVASHGTKLGFMSFFIKACISSLKELPAVNAEIQGDELVYKNYYNIGVAVGTESGLVVPVIKDADALGFADIELTINDFGKRARDGKLGMDEMQGGTFTISNGGVYGSLMSSPILNAPQSGILGMHKIQQRPVAINGQVEIRPMMYLALSYDHRIIDGREAVTFLVKVKEALEDPARLLFDM
ncbi:MAG: 2-oxoglutarate dehydrogenase complex dihydrolipoyllysine-residue succinyltransferase [Alphaproteobacteria bacterium]